ncbi:hypothetical protein NDU88_000962 [Pleurodeles waltl]|uniref:Uncharacterized protein n=1 Tax=Pleurodeles waltl TaxID=8319 RepID=A0AAV7WMV8_PLEWA|nr:hypothetical protein NDU88_000962 [Pleurodeles waltl]
MVPISSPRQSMPMVEPQVSSVPLGSTPAPDLNDGFDRSQPSSPVPHPQVLKPVSDVGQFYVKAEVRGQTEVA